VLYVAWIWQCCSILCSQADTSRAADLCHLEWTLPAGGELVFTFTGEYAPEQQIIHLELPTMYEPLVIASERLMVLCILESLLPSLLIDEVDIIMSELVLCDFIVCLDTGGDHGDLWGDNGLSPIHQEERSFPCGPT
jgi:hypothetical protein